MKPPSKLDQARAMREARYGASPAVAALPTAKRLNALPAEKRARGAARFVESQMDAAWLAPEGDCASCDKRRAALQATMRKRRERKAQE